MHSAGSRSRRQKHSQSHNSDNTVQYSMIQSFVSSTAVDCWVEFETGSRRAGRAGYTLRVVREWNCRSERYLLLYRWEWVFDSVEIVYLFQDVEQHWWMSRPSLSVHYRFCGNVLLLKWKTWRLTGSKMLCSRMQEDCSSLFPATFPSSLTLRKKYAS